MAVFLLMALGGLFFAWRLGAAREVEGGARGVFGGPVAVSAAINAEPEIILDNQSTIISSVIGGGSADAPVQSNLSIDSLSDPGRPVGFSSRGNLFAYKVRQGDTISGIAAYFGVSLDTIVNANPRVRGHFIKQGDSLNILPTSGVVYTTKDSDTLESISSYFNIPENKIAQYNQSINFGKLGAGVSLVIPGVSGNRFAQAGTGSLPNFSDKFVKPTEGFNWGILHNHNAVDVANSCGTPVRAAAEGLVVPDESFGDGKSGWNGGYGKFVLIEHPFGDGVRTRYAHLSSVLVNIGDYVKQGDKVGTMGESGEATGCHLHFEVYGALNFLAK